MVSSCQRRKRVCNSYILTSCSWLSTSMAIHVFRTTPVYSKVITQLQTLPNSWCLVKLALHSIKDHAIHQYALMATFTNVRSVKGWIMVHQTVINWLRALAGQPFWHLVLIWLALASQILWFQIQPWLCYHLCFTPLLHFPMLYSFHLFFLHLQLTWILLHAVTH